MSDVRVRRTVQGRVAVLTLDGPPVNVLCLSMRRELHEALQWAQEDEGVGALVLAGAGRGFSAGGDIREFGTPAVTADPGLSSHVHLAIERMSKPVVAVVHGFALGGGLETVLACHYRIAEENAALALPEISLGTLPLSATQRLPRLLGVLPALHFMAEGRTHLAAQFSASTLFDQVVEQGQGLATACALASDLAAVPLAPQELEQRLVRNHPVPGMDPERDLLDASLWLLLRQPNGVAQMLLKAVEAAVCSEDFDAGLECARKLFSQLMAGEDIRQARNQFLSAPSRRSLRVDPNDL